MARIKSNIRQQVPIKNTGLATGNCGTLEITCPNGSYHRVSITNCTSGDCERCREKVVLSACRRGGARNEKNPITRKPETKNFNGNNRVSQGRDISNGGLRLR